MGFHLAAAITMAAVVSAVVTGAVEVTVTTLEPPTTQWEQASLGLNLHGDSHCRSSAPTEGA